MKFREGKGEVKDQKENNLIRGNNKKEVEKEESRVRWSLRKGMEKFRTLKNENKEKPCDVKVIGSLKKKRKEW